MIQLSEGQLSEEAQKIVQMGFNTHSASLKAPSYEKKHFNWLAYDNEGNIIGALTADLLWDWLYIDELWVLESSRGQGLGRKLMNKAEEYAYNSGFSGLWLWTQSWQAAEFYEKLEYQEFTRFPNFPEGYSRIGFRKLIKAV